MSSDLLQAAIELDLCILELMSLLFTPTEITEIKSERKRQCEK